MHFALWIFLIVGVINTTCMFNNSMSASKPHRGLLPVTKTGETAWHLRTKFSKLKSHLYQLAYHHNFTSGVSDVTCQISTWLLK